jgi:hypothetical protein
MTSSARAATPSSVKCSATCSGVRAALFVTNPSRMPAERAALNFPGTPGTASGPT